MEHTGMYWRPVALALREAGFFVSVVNAILIHDFSDNSLRKVKTDRADALKIANYGLTFWQEEIFQHVKLCYLDTDDLRFSLKYGALNDPKP